jgi:hypothetical protein
MSIVLLSDKNLEVTHAVLCSRPARSNPKPICVSEHLEGRAHAWRSAYSFRNLICLCTPVSLTCMLVLHKVGELRQEWLQHAMETPPSPLRLCGSLAKGCCNGGGVDRGKKERAGMACTLEDEEMLQLRQGVMTPRSCFFSTKKVLSLTVVLVPTFSACKLLYFFVPSLARH